MRAVNLIPRDARRSGMGPSLGKLGASHFVIGLLVIVLGMVTLYVLASNTVSSRQSQLAGLKQQYSQMQAQVARLNAYAQFEKLAQAREETVREIAQSRFDWSSALSDLSKVVPANTSLSSLVATVSPTVGGGGGGGSVRGDIDAPAFELKGCTGNQDEVAQLMSRLRVINGVTRVTLEDSTAAASGGSSAAAPASSSSQTGGCPANGPTFDLVVFFQPGTGVLGATGGTSTTGSTK